ncbi:hypothetical protein V6N11_080191 [Hibiscus sabdariffa]|uniref:Uncharacterized protein n=1 Tax=Hibiscus sabdariffa TaxID=183260 RepID=A0ABR1ZWU7_9ROSI
MCRLDLIEAKLESEPGNDENLESSKLERNYLNMKVLRRKKNIANPKLPKSRIKWNPQQCRLMFIEGAGIELADP